MKNKGLFISFEGGEGVGKTTVIAEISRRLKPKFGNLMMTREPGGILPAEQIRKVILDNQIDGKTELLLYAAARNEHFLKKIQPALELGETVICDRFVDSSVVYQGVARGLGVGNVLKINDYILAGARPDITFVLDVAPEISQARISGVRAGNNRFDLESLEFHRQIRQGFLDLARDDERFVVIDSSQNIDLVVEQILEIINERFADRFEILPADKQILPADFKQKRILYTDGSASPNPGPGGFAVIENGRPIALGRENSSTNIRMEGLALLRALEILDGAPAEIWTDSEFWVNVLTKWASGWQAKGWRKSGGEIKNLDIVKPLFELYQKSKAELKWLRGHAGQEQNELADQWANKAREGEKIN